MSDFAMKFTTARLPIFMFTLIFHRPQLSLFRGASSNPLTACAADGAVCILTFVEHEINEWRIKS
jgi:hypothetical protein